MKKLLLTLLISATPALAIEEQALQLPQEQASETTGTNTVSETAPAKPIERPVNPNIRQVNLKNEFYQGVRINLEATDPSAEIKSKEIYLNPYQLRNNVSISKNTNYKISVYNFYDGYLGYLINTDTKNAATINISPFLLVQDVKKETYPVVLAPKETKQEEENTKAESVTNKVPEPKEIKTISTIDNTTSPVNSADKFIKIANLTEANFKLNIILPGGEIVNRTWNIDNDSYSPDFLEIDSKPFVVKPDYKITLVDKKTNEEINKTVSELSIDEKGNYVWIIGDKNSSDKPK